MAAGLEINRNFPLKYKFWADIFIKNWLADKLKIYDLNKDLESWIYYINLGRIYIFCKVDKQ